MKIWQCYPANVSAGFVFVTSPVEKEKVMVESFPVEGASSEYEGLVYLYVYSRQFVALRKRQRGYVFLHPILPRLLS